MLDAGVPQKQNKNKQIYSTNPGSITKNPSQDEK